VKNRILFPVFGVMVIALLFTLGGCSTADTEDTSSKAKPFPGNPSGKDSGRAAGYHGFVDVEITMVDGWITQVTVLGPEESPGVGAVAVELAPAEIKKKNSVDIDVLASATLTTNAIKEAGQQAIDKILAASGGN
jgi:fumarate reductase flavoprotein subunit